VPINSEINNIPKIGLGTYGLKTEEETYMILKAAI